MYAEIIKYLGYTHLWVRSRERTSVCYVYVANTIIYNDKA